MVRLVWDSLGLEDDPNGAKYPYRNDVVIDPELLEDATIWWGQGIGTAPEIVMPAKTARMLVQKLGKAIKEHEREKAATTKRGK